MILICNHLFTQDNQRPSFSYKLTKDIEESEEKRYLNARDYLIQDSMFCGKSIHFSPYLADLDFFFFKNIAKEDSILGSKLFLKSKWFEDYYSLRLNKIMGEQCRRANYIAFFSLIENDMLRIDVFQSRDNVSSFRFEDVSLFSGGGTYAYLFDFKKNSDNIRNVFKIEMIYD
jgi:hypothetical protein